MEIQPIIATQILISYHHIFEEIKNFFNIYKNLEGKQTKVDEFGGPVDAAKIIYKCIDIYNKKYNNSTEK